jgi:hypothetical protein
MRKISTLALGVALALGCSTAMAAGKEKAVTETATTGPYQLTLKVLPAESFTGADAEMVRDGGATPVELGGPSTPNHHLVVFVKKDSKPVADATVTVRYRLVGESASWVDLPVVRMHVAGKGRETTHYGNNVHLDNGAYEAEVTVNGSQPATFRFALPPAD